MYEKRRIIRPTCSTTSLHSCLVAGRHFLVFTLAHSSSSTNLVTGTWTRPHTSWGAVLQTCRATVLSLHTCTQGHKLQVTRLQGWRRITSISGMLVTCLGTGVQTCLEEVVHCLSTTSLVWALGTRVHTRRGVLSDSQLEYCP